MRYAYVLLCIICSTAASAMEVTSPDIHEGEPIAKEQVYTRCGGQNVSPALSWSGAPDATRSFAITAIDLSVKPNGWSHWIVVGLRAGKRTLNKGAALPNGAHGVTTDFGDAAYAGPCPPAGSGVHHYQFTVWALRTQTMELPTHATANEVAAALERVSLAKAAITGTYQR